VAILLVLEVISDRVARHTAGGATYGRPSAWSAYRRAN
jgi:hypothetical protein